MAAKAKGGLNKNIGYVPGKPKLTRQGMGTNTKFFLLFRFCLLCTWHAMLSGFRSTGPCHHYPYHWLTSW